MLKSIIQKNIILESSVVMLFKNLFKNKKSKDNKNSSENKEILPKNPNENTLDHNVVLDKNISSELPIDDNSIDDSSIIHNIKSPQVEQETSIVKSSWKDKLKMSLSKTRDNFGKKILSLFGGGKINEATYEELETILLSADVGYSATTKLLEEIRQKVSLKGLNDANELKSILKDSMISLLKSVHADDVQSTATTSLDLQSSQFVPHVIMLVGINGAGKTTTIGKLAHYYQNQGKQVVLAAGDTFRAAAKDQLLAWGARNNVTVVSQASGDSASVCFDAINKAIANNLDIVLADTAGRLPTQSNLMEEIKKVKRVINKACNTAPHEILLVLDATVGQNAITQLDAFNKALGVTGIVLTKLDGSAKGGVICAIAIEHKIPVKFIGIGESLEDLRVFDVDSYVDAMFE